MILRCSRAGSVGGRPLNSAVRPHQLCGWRYTSLTYNQHMQTFIESKLFTRLVNEYLSEDEYAALH